MLGTCVAASNILPFVVANLVSQRAVFEFELLSANRALLAGCRDAGPGLLALISLS